VGNLKISFPESLYCVKTGSVSPLKKSEKLMLMALINIYTLEIERIGSEEPTSCVVF
jgi:hypothetical protein